MTEAASQLGTTSSLNSRMRIETVIRAINSSRWRRRRRRTACDSEGAGAFAGRASATGESSAAASRITVADPFDRLSSIELTPDHASKAPKLEATQIPDLVKVGLVSPGSYGHFPSTVAG